MATETPHSFEGDEKMKLTTSLLAIAMIIGALCMVPAAVRKDVSQEPNDSHGGKIEGTWRVQVTQRNCQTGAELRTFPAMLTFAKGGTLTGTTTAFPVALRGPDHGLWSHTGNRDYQAVSEAFLFNSSGAWVQTQRITQSIELTADADTLNSKATVDFFDTSGNTVLTGCATAVATRME
jgi:hypothetical protein